MLYYLLAYLPSLRRRSRIGSVQAVISPVDFVRIVPRATRPMTRWFAWVLALGWFTYIAVVALGFTFPKAVGQLFGSANTYIILVLWLLLLLGGTFVCGLVFLFRLGMRRPQK